MDLLSELLRELSDHFEAMGGHGRIGLVIDWPVTVTVNDQKISSFVQVSWMENGLSIDDMPSQAERIVREIGEVVVGKRYIMRGKIGPWARRGAKGVRYLATGPQKQPVYKRILTATKEGGSWRYLLVCLEGETDVRSCWCGTNIYEEVNSG